MSKNGLVSAYLLLLFAVNPFTTTKASDFNISALLKSSSEAEAVSYLPEKQLSFPFIIAQAALSSDSFQAVMAQTFSINSPQLAAQSIYEARLVGEVSYLDDRLETASPLRPAKILNRRYSLGVEKGHQFGGQISANIIHERMDQKIDLQGQAPGGLNFSSDYFETRLEVGIQQSLWKNRFGVSSQWHNVAAKHRSEVLKQELKIAINNWFDDYLEIFSSAWLAKERVKSAITNVKRRERLLEMTNIRLSRGMAERSDVLQAESALIDAQINYNKSYQALSEIWKGLVVGLNLPRSWIDFDPMKIPLSPFGEAEEALQLCSKYTGVSDMQVIHPEVKKWKEAQKAANYQLRVAKESMKPSVNLFAQISTNAVDSNRSTETFTNLSRVDHNSVQVGVNLNIPLSRFSERAELANAYSQSMQSDALAKQSIKAFEVQWINTCNALSVQKSVLGKNKVSFDNQLERLSLEEQRFRIGRTSMLSVIQAGDDLAAAELNLRSNESNYYYQSWRVLSLASKVLSVIEDYIEKYTPEKVNFDEVFRQASRSLD